MESEVDVRSEYAGTSRIRRVVVGVDDSEAGLAALRLAVNLASTNRCQMLAIRTWALGLPRHGGRRLRHLYHPHVVLYFSGTEQCAAAHAVARRALKAAVGDIPRDLELRIETPAGDPGLVLTEIACEPGDVLVVGHERGIAVRGIIHGSVTAYCTSHAQCPVIVASPDRATGEAA
jgi:nucleotide-binding universal stress UspA family protein